MRSNQLVRAALCLALALEIAAAVELRAQCAMCWSALAHSAEGAGLIRGFNSGILFLLLVPFLVAGALTLLVYKFHRNAVAGERFEESEPRRQTETAEGIKPPARAVAAQ